MARRRRKSSAGVWKPLLLVALLGALGFGAWRYGPELMRSNFSVPPTAHSVDAPLDVCALVDPHALAAALAVDKAEARHVGPGADVPAAGACTWTIAHGGREARLVAMVFTRDSLAHSKQPALVGEKYFKSVVAGLEYAYKEPPVALPGIGDEAAAAGFGGGAGDAQIVARRGAAVLDLQVAGVDRAAAQRAAALIVAKI